MRPERVSVNAAVQSISAHLSFPFIRILLLNFHHIKNSEMERDPLGQNRPFRHQIDSWVAVLTTSASLTARSSDEEDEDMQGIYPGQQAKQADVVDIPLHFKDTVDAKYLDKSLLVALGEIGRHLVTRLQQVSVVNEILADGQVVGF